MNRFGTVTRTELRGGAATARPPLSWDRPTPGAPPRAAPPPPVSPPIGSWNDRIGGPAGAIGRRTSAGAAAGSASTSAPLRLVLAWTRRRAPPPTPRGRQGVAA